MFKMEFQSLLFCSMDTELETAAGYRGEITSIPAIQPIFDEIANNAWKEVTKL